MRDRMLGRTVAMKILREDKLSSGAAIVRAPAQLLPTRSHSRADSLPRERDFTSPISTAAASQSNLAMTASSTPKHGQQQQQLQQTLQPSQYPSPSKVGLSPPIH